MKSKIMEDLFLFLDGSPSPWHTIESSVERLKKKNFSHLEEKKKWSLNNGESYFVTRNGSSICAFSLPTSTPTRSLIAGAHTDSPALKLKPNSEFQRDNAIMLSGEIYGGPLLNSWLNRELGIAGRISFKSSPQRINTKLVNITHAPLVIPQLAIHLDREVNSKGLLLNKQEHLHALATLDTNSKKKESYLSTLLRPYTKGKKLLESDLFLYPLEKAKYIGANKELFSSYRIDNLSSSHAALHGLLSLKKPSKDTIRIVMLWDNEEVGSQTSQGAASPFLLNTIERICLSLGLPREAFFQIVSQSLLLSIDMAHALHPNYSSLHEPNHQPLLGKGITLKVNAQQRYGSQAFSSSFVAAICEKLRLPLQKFVGRNDLPCGSTIGPISSTVTGIPSVDIGAPQLSMHSARELAATADHLSMCRFIQGAFESDYFIGSIE